jgi:hypothetical protein
MAPCATEPLLVNYYGKAVPSMALLAAANSLNLGPADIKLNVGDSVQIGKLRVKTDDYAGCCRSSTRAAMANRRLPSIRFMTCLSGKIPASKYADKIVTDRRHRQWCGRAVSRCRAMPACPLLR